MQDTNQLSPAQLAKKLVEHAKKVEEQQFWALYEADNMRARNARLGIPHTRAPHGTLRRFRTGCRCDACYEKQNAYWREYRSRKRAETPKAPRAPRVERREVRDDQHGTITGYSYGCRCDSCKQARRDYYQLSKRPKEQIPHGTLTKYRYGCRCEPCRHSTRVSRKHGANEYKNGCRCLTCTEAHREATRRRVAVARSRKTPAHVHGTDHGYGYYGCRCEPCTKAASESRRRRAMRQLESRDV